MPLARLGGQQRRCWRADCDDGPPRGAAGCRAVVADVMAAEGRLDVLCNNAGVHRRGALLDLTPEGWNLSCAINIDAMLHLCQAALPDVIAAGVKRSGRSIADLDRMVPYGQIGRPDEVAALVAFLASDEAALMCGSLVDITGAQAVY